MSVDKRTRPRGAGVSKALPGSAGWGGSQARVPSCLGDSGV